MLKKASEIDVMNKIERLSIVDQGIPIVAVNISNCGEILPGKDNRIVAIDEGTFIF